MLMAMAAMAATPPLWLATALTKARSIGKSKTRGAQHGVRRVIRILFF